MAVNRRLLLSMLLGPIVWLAGLELLFALVPWSCRHPAVPSALLLPVIGIVAGLGCGVAAAVGWHAWRAIASGADAPSPATERVRFMALAGLGSGALFALASLATIVPALVLKPCV